MNFFRTGKISISRYSHVTGKGIINPPVEGKIVALMILFILSIFPTLCSGAEEAFPGSFTGNLPIQFSIKVERKGDFLTNSAGESLELLRRLGRKLADKTKIFEKNVIAIAGFSPETIEIDPEALKGKKELPFVRVIKSDDWSPSQKAEAEKIFQDNSILMASLSAEIKEPQSGLYITGIINPKNMAEAMEKFVTKLDESKDASLKIQQRADKIRDRILPILDSVRALAWTGSLTRTAFTLRLDLQGKQEFTALVKAMLSDSKGIAVAKYIDPSALMVFCQNQKIGDPAAMMENFRNIPQTRLVEGYLASVGLSLEKDIIPTYPEDSLMMINLDPVGEGGTPDIRFITIVRDISKLLGIAGGLKQLAMSIGIFIQPNTEMVPTFRVSYFLFPAYAMHFTLAEDLLVFGTSREKIIETTKRIADVKAGKIPAFVLPEGTNRYWKIRFSDLNEQLQKFLQSPLLADKGIPPLTNLTILKELGELTVITKILESSIEIRVSLPFVSQ